MNVNTKTKVLPGWRIQDMDAAVTICVTDKGMAEMAAWLTVARHSWTGFVG